MTMPPSMKELDIEYTSVKIDVAAIEWPANATALKYDGNRDCGALVCRITDPDESKEGAETRIRITCKKDQVIGDIAQLNLPVGMKDLNLSKTNVTGKQRLSEVHFPDYFKYGFKRPAAHASSFLI